MFFLFFLHPLGVFMDGFAPDGFAPDGFAPSFYSDRLDSRRVESAVAVVFHVSHVRVWVDE